MCYQTAMLRGYETAIYLLLPPATYTFGSSTGLFTSAVLPFCATTGEGPPYGIISSVALARCSNSSGCLRKRGGQTKIKRLMARKIGSCSIVVGIILKVDRSSLTASRHPISEHKSGQQW